jgi:hypothetical protein
MSGIKERFTETEAEAVFEIEISDIRHLVAAPEQDPFSDRPMEYLGESAMERMIKIQQPLKNGKGKGYRLILRMPSDKVSSETASQAKALISKFGARMTEDNKNHIIQIQRRGRRQLPYALIVLFLFIALGIAFSMEFFLEMSPILALAISEGFYIVGWIALWRPIDVLLFDPMEIRMENKVLARLMEMNVDVVPI